MINNQLVMNVNPVDENICRIFSKPLTEAFIRKFLSTSAMPFADIMRMTETEVVNAATERLMVLESQIAHWKSEIEYNMERAWLGAEQKICMAG